ncbi:hypothetical protein MMC08_001394 [Hypocenomyce scalaris]|nr:hypothetical protein [Hypocenomyce scalaris]
MEAEQGNVSALDSNLFRTIFGSDQMRLIMSDAAYVERMVQVEKTLARVQGRLGIIPRTAADEIARACDSCKLDRDKLQHDTQLVGLPVWGLVRQLIKTAGPQSGRYVHWGLNTHDVMDLAQALQMKQGLELIKVQLDSVRDCLIRLARCHRSTSMVARTHLQHALPTTFGCRVAIWLSAFDRHAERLPQLASRVLLAQVGGASGSLASFGGTVEDSETDPAGFKVLRAMADELGLVEPPIPWHAARDGLVEGVSFLGMIGGSLAKIAQDVCAALYSELF